MNFKDKKVLVTGASRGIGRAVAQAFAGEGARVAVHFGRDRLAAEETIASLAGGAHCAVEADLSESEAVAALVDTVVGKLGGLDVLVNNAGIWDEHRIAEITFDEWLAAWQRILAVNLLGPASLTFHAARLMMEQGGGSIVNVSSRGAFRGEPDGPAYAASKAGLNSMSQSLAKALAPHNISVTVVAPGFVETDMAKEFLSGPDGEAIRAQSPFHRVARPEEVAHAVLFLASDRSLFLSGGIVDVNGASYLRS